MFIQASQGLKYGGMRVTGTQGAGCRSSRNGWGCLGESTEWEGDQDRVLWEKPLSKGQKIEEEMQKGSKEEQPAEWEDPRESMLPREQAQHQMWLGHEARKGLWNTPWILPLWPWQELTLMWWRQKPTCQGLQNEWLEGRSKPINGSWKQFRMQVAFDVESNKMKKNEVATVVGKREGGEEPEGEKALWSKIYISLSLSQKC